MKFLNITLLSLMVMLNTSANFSDWFAREYKEHKKNEKGEIVERGTYHEIRSQNSSQLMTIVKLLATGALLTAANSETLGSTMEACGWNKDDAKSASCLNFGLAAWSLMSENKQVEQYAKFAPIFTTSYMIAQNKYVKEWLKNLYFVGNGLGSPFGIAATTTAIYLAFKEFLQQKLPDTFGENLNNKEFVDIKTAQGIFRYHRD